VSTNHPSNRPPTDRVTAKKGRVKDADQGLEPLDPEIAQAIRNYRGYEV